MCGLEGSGYGVAFFFALREGDGHVSLELLDRCFNLMRAGEEGGKLVLFFSPDVQL